MKCPRCGAVAPEHSLALMCPCGHDFGAGPRLVRPMEPMAGRLAHMLVVCAAVFPLVPVSGQSALAPFVLAIIYAVAVYTWLGGRAPTASYQLYILAGSGVGLVPGLFYAATLPFSSHAAPVMRVLLIGIVCGPLLGGAGFAMLRRQYE